MLLFNPCPFGVIVDILTALTLQMLLFNPCPFGVIVDILTALTLRMLLFNPVTTALTFT